MFSSRLGPRPWIAGHRGAPAEGLVENTLASLRRAVERGADFVEIDVWLSADGQLIVVHDADLGRVAGRGGVVIERSTAREIRRHPIPGTHPAEPVPTLAEVFEALPSGFPINVELKRNEAPLEDLAGAALAAGAGRSVLVSSFDWELLDALRGNDRRLPLALLADDEAAAAGLAAASVRLTPWSWHVAQAAVSDPVLEAARLAGAPLIVYTVNDATVAARLFSRGVSGVFSDDPAALTSRSPSAPRPSSSCPR